MHLRATESTKAGMKATDRALASPCASPHGLSLADRLLQGRQASALGQIGFGSVAQKLAEPQKQSLAQAVTNQALLQQHGFEVVFGMTMQKPLYQAWQQDTERVRKWETEEFLAIKQQAREQVTTVFLANEAGIRSGYHMGTGGTDARGDSHRPALRAQHTLSGQFSFILHDGPGPQDFPAARDGEHKQSSARGGS